MKTCTHGIALVEDWCSQCKGAPKGEPVEKRKPGYEDPAAFDHVSDTEEYCGCEGDPSELCFLCEISEEEAEALLADSKLGDPKP